MRVYHGSGVFIEEIDLAQCRPGRDFGQGFYVTNIRRQAEVWAERKSLEAGDAGVITEYDFNEYAYKYDKLKVLVFESYSEEWFDFVLLNRGNMTKQAHDYDIVEGPVADDQVATRRFHYQEGRITKQPFLEELQFKKATHQMCFCTPDALQMLTLVRPTADADIVLISEQIVEALVGNRGYSELQAVDVWYCSDTYKQLSDEATEMYKLAWKQIYEHLIREIEH
jgi:hypothetical protein